jgi:hypothetical protein
MNHTDTIINLEDNPLLKLGTKLNGPKSDLEQHIASITQKEQVETVAGLLPIDGFPLFVQKLIVNSVEVYGIHRDFFAGAFLAAVSVAIGDTCELDAMEYRNSTNLWIAIISPSGQGKSTPKKIFISPITDLDAKAYKEYKKEMEHLDSIQSTVKRSPFINRVTNGKASPEALIDMLDKDARGSLLYRDEILSMIKDYDKENSGFMDAMLSFYSGEGTSIRTLSRGVQYVKRAFLPIFGGIQPHLLQALGKEGRDNNGFMARFCCIFPDDASRQYHTDKKISAELTLEYYDFLKQLFSIEYKTDDPYQLTLSQEAKREYIKFYNKNVDVVNDKLTSPFLRQATAKLDIFALRLALLLHLSKRVTYEVVGDVITVATMIDAINMTEYFRSTSRKVEDVLCGKKTSSINNSAVAQFLDKKGNSQYEIANVLKISQPAVHKILKKGG